MQLVFRFIVGGLVVSFFAVLGDGLKPKSFPGLFAAAPSVALAMFALTVFADGKDYASLEARSMIVGACAFFVYSCLCMRIMAKTRVARAARGYLTGNKRKYNVDANVVPTQPTHQLSTDDILSRNQPLRDRSLVTPTASTRPTTHHPAGAEHNSVYRGKPNCADTRGVGE